MTHKRKLAVGTVGITCLVTGILAALSAWEGARITKRLSEARAERPVSFTTSLSETNSLKAQLSRKHDLGHGMDIWMENPGLDESGLSNHLAGLRVLTKVAFNQDAILSNTIDGTIATLSAAPEFHGCVWLGRIGASHTGAGEFHFEVVEPATGLGDSKARIFLANSYCGLEGLAVGIMWIVAVASAMASLVSGLITRSLVKSSAVQSPSSTAVATP